MRNSPLHRVGVDIGGTFTDLAGWRDGQLSIAKALSTPAEPTEGVAQVLAESGTRIATIDELAHGATVAINAVLERKGARTALITTRGFRDVYEIGRSNRPESFDIFFRRPEPLVARDLRFEVDERVNAAGEVLTPLDADAVRRIGAELAAGGIEAIAVCFLHAYANPAHEAAAGQILREAHPRLFITCSHEILREFREYERTSTTVLNAYVGPRVRGYLERLDAHLRESGFGGTVHIMRSNGGSMSLGHAIEQPVAMMESGPVAGMIGAGHVARLLGLERAIGFDMGGTTAKATLITGGEPTIEEGYHIGGYARGQPMQLPVVDIVEVGAGGGSLAWRDPGGGVHVGPQSAGAAPGPACYGRGGTAPTVTDANLVLGRLNARRFLGGGMPLDGAAARTAIDTALATPLGLSTYQAALGILRIADSAMGLAVRAVSVKKGVDPRDTAMIAFGGAGPLHAAALCKEITIPRLVIPKLPGNFSALGMLLAEWRHDFVRTLVGGFGKIARSTVLEAFAELDAAARKQLERDRHDPARASLRYAADLRYRGQEHTIAVPIDGPASLAGAEPAVRAAFDALHDERYGHAAATESIEVVNVRLTVTVARRDEGSAGFLGAPYTPVDARAAERRTVYFAEGPLEAAIHWRPGLTPGSVLDGPAVIEESNSTTLLHPGDRARVSAHGHLEIEIKL